MEIKKLNKNEYVGQKFTLRYTTKGYYDIQRNDMGFRFEYCSFEKPIEMTFDDYFFNEWLEDPVAYGAFENGQFLGYVEGTLEKWNNRYRISNICVFEDGRRHSGIGTALMDTILKEAKESSARMVVLETQTCNENAIAFYRKHGFEIIGFDLFAYTNTDPERHEVRIEMGKKLLENNELNRIFLLFFDELPCRYEIRNTSRGDRDFRETIMAQWPSGERYVIKLSDNDFTFPEKIGIWKRCGEEYGKLGYYCPKILPSKQGDFPIVTYKGHNCVAYGEEFCKYTVLQDRFREEPKEKIPSYTKWADEAWIMTAKVAAKQFDFSSYPSGYCLFETFCPGDETDEVMENALEWKNYANTLPEKFQPQIQRIWHRWIHNRNALEQMYSQLPISVFQADLNPTNLLVDDQGEFVGVFDFNLCGHDVFLNYLFREIHFQYSEEYLLDTLKRVSPFYPFSPLEKQVAPLLYRCLKPLWFTEIEKLKEAGMDDSSIQACLDQTEELQTKEIPFGEYMDEQSSKNRYCK